MLTNRVLSVALTALSSLALLSLSTAANAQAYKGNAYILSGNVGVNVGPGATPLVNVGVGAEINRVDLPHPNGGAGNSANNNNAGLGVNIGTAVALNAVTSSTAEIASAVTSNAQVTGANILPNFSTLLPNSVAIPGVGLNLNLLGLVTTNVNLGFGSILGSLTQAGVIGATANDTPSIVAHGTSNIVGLSLLSQTINVAVDGFGNPLPNQRFAITVPINLSATVSGNVQVGPVSVPVANVALAGTANAEIGEIIINEQLPGGDPNLITVNALHIKLYPEVDLPDVTLSGNVSVAGLGLVTLSANAVLPNTNILGNNLATTNLIVSSATAGAAPEPGSLALIGGVGILGLVGVARRKRIAK